MKIIVIFFSLFAFSFLAAPTTGAVSASSWQAGNIIDDLEFTDSKSMSVSQIQAFLDARLQNCDYYGTKTSELSGGTDYNKDGKVTRAEYGRSKGNPAPFTCLNDYYEVPKTAPGSTTPASNYGKSTRPSGSKSAAQLIYDAAQAYKISPKVLLVKLATESAGPLTSDPWPFKRQYTYAMGARCPDSGPGGSANCDANYSGFSLQMREAASLLRWYLDSMDESWWSYKTPNATNYILWNIQESRCGGRNVFIQNSATAALYTYTPYQPNAAALNNLYGSGDGCSAYGNRNFWRVYSDWFGSTYSSALQISRGLWVSPSDPTNLSTMSASFILKNNANYPITLEEMTVAVRDKDNQVLNFPHVSNVTIQPGKTYTYHQSQPGLETDGTHRAFIAIRMPSGGWSYNWPYEANRYIERSKTFEVKQNPDISLTRNLYFSRTNEYTNHDLSSASFIVKNNETTSKNISELRVAAVHESGKRVDFPIVKNITLEPGEEYTYYQSTRLYYAGNYQIFVEARDINNRWSNDWPISASESIVRQQSVQILRPADVSMKRELYVSPWPLLAGQQAASSFIIKNNESTEVTIAELAVRGRDSKNRNYDFPSIYNLTLEPGEEYTYYQYRDIDRVDSFRFNVSAKINNLWTDTWPHANGQNKLKTVNSKLPNVTISRSMYESPKNASVNEQKAASFVVTNNENRTIRLESIGIAVRDRDNAVVNFPFTQNLVLEPGQSHEYYEYMTFEKSGKYRMWIASRLPQGSWSNTWPYSATDTLIRSREFYLKP